MNPYRVLDIPDDTDDDGTIRNAWLEAVRRFPPEQHPERFATIREAYERIRDRESRYALRTFGDPRLSDDDALSALFPPERNRAGAALWLAVIRGGTR